jgi:hypothetical protein
LIETFASVLSVGPEHSFGPIPAPWRNFSRCRPEFVGYRGFPLAGCSSIVQSVPSLFSRLPAVGFLPRGMIFLHRQNLAKKDVTSYARQT